MQSLTKERLWHGGSSGRRVFPLVLALAGGCLIAAYGITEGQDAAPESHPLQHPRPHYRSGLEDRVRTFSKAFDLDARQQDELRKVLENQREQIRKVWREGSVPPDYRVSATRLIYDQTEDRIRALLNDEQRKKYKLPKPSNESAVRSDQRSVEYWMNAAKPK
jgi:hypothetical protein